MARAIITLSRALALPIVAEGVETEQDAQILTLAGCDYLQGWHLGRPAPAAEIAGLFDIDHPVPARRAGTRRRDRAAR